MVRKKDRSGWTSVWNAGTAVNVLLIPAITLLLGGVSFWAYTNAKIPVYDKAVLDVGLIQIHNAAQDEKVLQMIAQLAEISAQLRTLNSLPKTGVGGGAGGTTDGNRDGRR